MNTKTNEFIKGVIKYNSIKPTGAIVVTFQTFDNVEYIQHQPKEFTFVSAKEIVIINEREYLKSDYLIPLLERRFSTLFMLPTDNRD
jgi:hypothetical protein